MNQFDEQIITKVSLFLDLTQGILSGLGIFVILASYYAIRVKKNRLYFADTPLNALIVERCKVLRFEIFFSDLPA